MLYDTHAHLDYPDFQGDLPQVLERARTAGITRIITIGTDLESSKRAVFLSEQHEMIYAAVGWHPSDAERAPANVSGPLRELALHPKVVAIGETGLDYHRLPSKVKGADLQEDARYIAKQKEIFQQQLDLGAELGLNCVVHQRDCFEDTLALVAAMAGRVRTVFHCFAGSPSELQRVLATGSLVSFTGIITFKNAQSVRETVAAAAPGQFMFETDAPFLAPVPFRGKRCEPAHVRETALAVQQAKQMTLESLSQATCSAAHSFFPKLLG